MSDPDFDLPDIAITADRARVTRKDGRVLYSGSDINRAFTVLDKAREARWRRLMRQSRGDHQTKESTKTI